MIPKITDYEYTICKEHLDIIIVIRYRFNDEWYTVKSQPLDTFFTQGETLINNIVHEVIKILTREINIRIEEYEANVG